MLQIGLLQVPLLLQLGQKPGGEIVGVEKWKDKISHFIQSFLEGQLILFIIYYFIDIIFQLQEKAVNRKQYLREKRSLHYKVIICRLKLQVLSFLLLVVKK